MVAGNKLIFAWMLVVATLPVCAACAREAEQPPATQPAPAPTPAPSTPQTQPEMKPATKPELQPDPKPEAKKNSNPAPATTTPAPADPWPAPANAALPTLNFKLSGKTFKLEKAMEDQIRFGGLSGRKDVAVDGGMIFVFKNPQPLSFVMRDCPIPIDIIYVDATGRITAMYNMTPEPPRAADEQPIPNDRYPKWAWTNDKYEARLKKYPSRFAAVIAIELKANTLNIDGSNKDGIALKVGDKLELDMAALRQQAK